MCRIAATVMLLTLTLAAAALPGGEPSPDEDPHAVHLELVPERPPADGEDLWLEVEVGALPANATLVVRDAAGEKIGAVSPFGKSVREAGGAHLLPLPESLQTGEQLELSVELTLPDDVVRRPTEDELREVRLVYVPVSE